jgi:hypothetical protein
MTQVIEYPLEVIEAERKYSSKLDEETNRREEKQQEYKDLQAGVLKDEAKAAHAKGEEKKTLTANIKAYRARMKQIKVEIDNIDSSIEHYENELGRLKISQNKDHVAKNNSSAALQVFQDHNIHYVIMDQQWWSVDAKHDRRDIKINSSDVAVIKDLIYYESDWIIRDEQELKSLAKSQGRMFNHIVRDFVTTPRPGIYNQMTDIRRYWLQPVYDVEPHEAFRILCLSIAGGAGEYADQLERYVAYRYCHPEDVMIPNIDSCATGGTGRDTFYNILRTIFTDECCGSVGEETFKGTHNGDLFGKMIVKVDEKDSRAVPIDKIKELTGSTNYRHRAMNKDARDVLRLFNFFFFRNGYTTTAKLAGTGTSGEDRRFEPIIARVNLTRHMAFHYGIIDNINVMLEEEEEKAMTILVKDWQRDYYKNEERIAEWLGHIIKKHDAENMKEFLPIHGTYYKEMIMRQKKGIEVFMPKLLAAMKDSTVIATKDAHKLYEAAESVKCTKDWFKNQMLYWLNSKMGWDAVEEQEDTYPFAGAVNSDRRRFFVIKNRLALPAKAVWALDDFIDQDALDDKGNRVGSKVNQFSLRDELK